MTMKGWQKGVLLIGIIASSFAIYPYAVAGLNTFLDQWGLLPGEFIPNPLDNDEKVYVKLPIINGLNDSLLAGATVKVKGENGATSSGASTTSGYTSTAQFEEGTMVDYIISLSGHYTVVGEFKVPIADYSLLNTYVTENIPIYEVATGDSVSCSDQNGNAITASSGFNITTYGTTLILDIKVSITDADHVFGNAYANWDDGYEYKGPLVVLTADSNQYVVSGADVVDNVGTTYYYVVYCNRLINDANIATDGSMTVQLTIECQTTGNDAIDVFVFDEVRTDLIETNNFGTADCSVENIDIVSA